MEVSVFILSVPLHVWQRDARFLLSGPQLPQLWDERAELDSKISSKYTARKLEISQCLMLNPH